MNTENESPAPAAPHPAQGAELLPCPFCGVVPEVGKLGTIQCLNPNCAVNVVTIEGREQAWNTRAPSPEAQGAEDDVTDQLAAMIHAVCKCDCPHRYGEQRADRAEAERDKARQMYDEAIIASNQAGYACVSAADTIRDLSTRLATAEAERANLAANLAHADEKIRELQKYIAEQLKAQATEAKA